jgi:predicted DNA-binding transcriptional regulator AlpA
MEKQNFYFTPMQLKRLQEESDKTGLSMSEILRRILDDYFKNKKEE